ncbi:MAG: lysophospholipid acyltransferase family protein [Flavobacteriales bacterium]|jgi:KDO2-lipid IV(A) lauroyltransferase|nr:lysophospholipid acyltransferase family protein [Flavobacteriales bacterium]
MYRILKLVLGAIASLPWWALYVLADLFHFLIYHVIWYRRKMVWRNLSAAFPEKSVEEINEINIQFYKNFCDQVVETIKLFRSTPEEISERFEVDTTVYDKLFSEGRHVLQATSHQFNWEWGNWILNHHTQFHLRIIYMIQKNKSMERLVNEYRVRYGTELIPANDLKAMMTDPAQPTMTVFLADQNPSDRKRAAWVSFFGREIPFHRGLEILARRKGHAVVFDEMIRVKRGHYKSVSKLAFTDGSKTSEGEITEAYVQFLEESIKRQPENWLWSHNRWKHARQS